MMVLLDNGHGYDTPGKRSPMWSDGTLLNEWEFNRDVVRRIADQLIILRIPHYILVPEAKDISLKMRCDRANAISKKYPGSFGISIHANADADNDQPGDPIAEGFEAFTYFGQSESDVIAAFIYDAAHVLPFRRRTDYLDGDADKEENLAMLRDTKCPWVLTENGFMDNEKECRFMMSDYGRDLIARMHADAIYKYYKLNAV